MRSVALAGIIASLTLGLASARVDAQEHTGKPVATTAKPAPAPAPASGASHAPVIVPSKPVVAPGIAPLGDAGATPASARPAGARTLSVSARQAAEQTIAALVAAMKNLPKRPPAPRESRTARVKSAEAAASGLADALTPITYHVTWPVTPPELGLDTQVELVSPGRAAAPVSLRWNELPAD